MEKVIGLSRQCDNAILIAGSISLSLRQCDYDFLSRCILLVMLRVEEEFLLKPAK